MQGGVLWPLVQAVKTLTPPGALVELISRQVEDDGRVKDNASESVQRCRQRVSQLDARLTNLLRGGGGQVGMQAGRHCLQVAAGT